MSAQRRPMTDEYPDDEDTGLPAALAAVLLIAGVAVGFGAALWLAAFHAAGTGRGLW